jgi:hypothetical protein
MTPVRHERIVQVRLLDWSNLCWIQDREQFSIGLTLVFFMDPCCLADQTEYSGMACRFPKGRGECRVLAFGLNRNNHDSLRLLETEIGNVGSVATKNLMFLGEKLQSLSSCSCIKQFIRIQMAMFASRKKTLLKLS